MRDPFAPLPALPFNVSDGVLLRLTALAYETETPSLDLWQVGCPVCGASELRAEARLRLESIRLSSGFPKYQVRVRCLRCSERWDGRAEISAPGSVQYRAREAYARLHGARTSGEQ